jgi:hypothetical protein
MIHSLESRALTPCQKCGCELQLHQPDPDLPTRLLGTCEECKSWFLLDLVAGSMTLLVSKRAARRKRLHAEVA